MKENIVVLGATGTLGTYLIDQLQAEGRYTIYACGSRNVNKEYYTSKGIKGVKVDLTDPKDFDQLPKENVKAVIQLAGVMPSRMVGYDPYLYIDVNVRGTMNVLEYCRVANVGQYLFTQSHSDVAGHWNTGKKISPFAARELNYKGDHAVYIISKNAAVDLSEHYYQDYGIKNIIFRLPTVYCYRPIIDMFVNGKKTNIAYRYLIHQAIKGETLEIWGDPKAAKDIVYVKDFTQMISKALESEKALGFYNVGRGIGTSLEEQIKGVVEVFSPEEKRSKIIYKPEKPTQTTYLYDIDNAIQDFNYNPQYNYIEMLKDMKNEMINDRFAHIDSSNVLYKK